VGVPPACHEGVSPSFIVPYGERDVKPKSEARNPKSETNSKIQKKKIPNGGWHAGVDS